MMRTNKSNSFYKFIQNRLEQDKVLVVKNIVLKIEKGAGFTILELKKKYNEKELFYHALKHVTTSKKPLSLALELPVEACCRYKCQLEESGLLMQSAEKVTCPYNTKEKAHFISTNPYEFEKLCKIVTNQLSMFE